MPKVTADFCKLVRVTIRGEKREDPSRYLLPDDGGIVHDFTVWCDQYGIEPEFVLTSGGGRKVALFWEQHIPAVRKWLAERGVELSPVYDAGPEA